MSVSVRVLAGRVHAAGSSGRSSVVSVMMGELKRDLSGEFEEGWLAASVGDDGNETRIMSEREGVADGSVARSD